MTERSLRQIVTESVTIASLCVNLARVITVNTNLEPPHTTPQAEANEDDDDDDRLIVLRHHHPSLLDLLCAVPALFD
jgi:hypothetical protein